MCFQVFHCVHFECPSQVDEDLVNDDGSIPSEETQDTQVANLVPAKLRPHSTTPSSRSTTPQRAQLPLMGIDASNNDNVEDEEKVASDPAILPPPVPEGDLMQEEVDAETDHPVD